MRLTPLFLPVLHFALFVAIPNLNADEVGRALFDFDDASASEWQIVNDGVMGGLSKGAIKMDDDGHIRFFGELSLKNNGGFASVRSRPKDLNLNDGDSILLRVRGDGRKYTLNAYVPTRQVAFSYQADFETKRDKWTEVSIPLERLQAMSFGRPVRNSELQPSQVNSVGILLGDKKAGPFEILVDWIRVVPAQ